VNILYIPTKDVFFSFSSNKNVRELKLGTRERKGTGKSGTKERED
jgi:hypothetical protein